MLDRHTVVGDCTWGANTLFLIESRSPGRVEIWQEKEKKCG